MTDESQIFLTPDGLEKSKRELAELKTSRRKEVAARIETAKALGDLSENAEYQDAKDESAWVEGRIQELEAIVARATVVQGGRTDVVTIGKTVIIKNEQGEKMFVIVGANEADPVHGRISSGSPLASALLERHVGDEVEVNTPSGIQHYTVVKIE